MTPEQAGLYLNKRYRSYDERAVRYRLAVYAMVLMGFNEGSSVLDIGGGDAEMEKCLREEFGWRGVYTNVDHTTGHNILGVLTQGPGYWNHDYVVSLEVVEHFDTTTAHWMLDRMQKFARNGIVVSTPNGAVQDVAAMDPTHQCGMRKRAFEVRGYTVEEHLLYDGYYSNGVPDGLIAYKEVK